jgi:hypothetical protein
MPPQEGVAEEDVLTAACLRRDSRLSTPGPACASRTPPQSRLEQRAESGDGRGER